ncbi:MAG: hypothetical protein U0350_47375 [Caldilineaceae bacterium]
MPLPCLFTLFVTLLFSGWLFYAGLGFGIRPARAAAEATPQATPDKQTPTDATANPNSVNSTREAKHVKVNFFINSISNVNDETGTYDIDFWLDLFWADPSLNGKTIDEVDTTKLWQPQIDIVNSRNHTVLFQGFDNSLEPDTNVRLTYRFAATLSNKFDLHRFPFDQQTFVIKLESNQYESNMVLFDLLALEEAPAPSEKPFIQAIPAGKYLANDVAVEGWTLSDSRIVQQLRLLAYDKSTWSQFRIEMTGTRLAGSYLWRIYLILAFLMVLGWVIFLIDAKDLRYRLLLLFTLVLALVTFNFTMIQILPKLAYLTLLDRYVLICYGLLAFNLVAALILKVLPEQWAERLNRLLLLAYPLLLVIVQLAVYWYAVA